MVPVPTSLEFPFLLLCGLVSAAQNLRYIPGVDGRIRLPRPASSILNDKLPEFASINGYTSSTAQVEPRFLNANTTRFAVNGTSIPDVDFDVGESYAGLLPITGDPNDPNQLFFWFFPSNNPAADREIVIWLNGGPGCSSFEGLVQENGPFLWQDGTLKPVPNPWSWTKLTNMVWVEQPVGTGFTTGTVTAKNEADIASQFLGFWKNFVNAFSMHGYRVYISGESYAGMYCPYIADAMLNAKDKTYFNMTGMLIYDPSIAADGISQAVTTIGLVDAWPGVFPFNDTFMDDIRGRDQRCGFTDYVNDGLRYPPRGPLPSKVPGMDDEACASIFNDVFTAALTLNPCFNIYLITQGCPLLWDVLGFPGSIQYTPEGATVYFNRTEVKRAIHAPLNSSWEICSSDNVFVEGTDQSAPSALTVLPGVIERTQNVIIGHGSLDMVLIANGTLLAIQNMTWGGQLGFQKRPSDPFYVPRHNEVSLATMAGSGVMGVTHTERGLTYVGIEFSGHMVPQYQPTAAFRHLEVLLGRVANLSSTEAFTTNKNVTQPSPGELGGPPSASKLNGHGTSKSAAQVILPVSKVAMFMASVMIVVGLAA